MTFVTAPKATELSPDQPDPYPEHPGAYPEHRWNYKVRVRGTGYLWGSAGVSKDASFPAPLLLHIHNDTFGEPITFGTQTANGHQTALGTLQAGEQFSISIQRISAVFATCNFESTVTCWLRKS
jgi:hypothetical protein